VFKNIVPLNKDRHAKTRIKEITDFGFVSQLHIAYVTLHEFARAAAIFPIVFLEDKAKDEFRPVVLMGLNAGENLFVSADGKWNASYVPAIIRRYPFALAPKPDSTEYLVCLDEDSTLVNQTEGNALFDEKGEPTQVIENVKRYLTELQQMDMITNGFCKFLAEHNMFTPLNMKVRDDAEVKSIGGCYVINEQRLNSLSDELFLEIKNKQYLPAIYAHLVSLAQTERLVKFKDERVAKK
jgi:SapC